MRDIRQEWLKYKNSDPYDDDERKDFRFQRQFDLNDPMVEQEGWRFNLKRLFHETVRRQQPNSNLPPAMSEDERGMWRNVYMFNAGMQAILDPNLKEIYDSPEAFLNEKAKVAESEDFFYGLLILEATRNVRMNPYSEELSFRKGEITLRQVANEMDFRVYSWQHITKLIDQENPKSLRNKFEQVTVFSLIPPVSNPSLALFIVHNKEHETSTRWEISSCQIKDWNKIKDDLKNFKTSGGECSVSFLKPLPHPSMEDIPF